MTRLGQKVRELRLETGMTQRRLAEAGAISHSLVNALETGRRKYVNAIDIRGLAKGLQVPEDNLWRVVPGGRSEARYICLTG